MAPPSHNSSAPKIMVFRPDLEEMKDFSAYIAHMESMGAHKAGIAKIIPPKEFVAAYDYEKAENITIPAPIQQEVMGHQGLYTQYNIQKKPLTLKEFRKLANSSRYATPPHFDYDDLERKYWKNITYNPPIYAADISGSLYSKGCNIWNINKLNTLLDVIEEEQGVKIEGVNTAYLYFGMWKTTFAWHTEDMDLYSINYLHFGAPKSWYGIPPEHAKRLERLAAGFFPQSFQICPNFLRHKMTLISPQILKKYSIPYDKITQETGEFMVTFPYGYHAGYNHGYNCAESTNFASLRWIDFGKRAKCCSCQRDSVKINMEPFVRIFQPDRYEAWKQGEDIVYIEDIDKPSSGIQSQNIMEYNSPRKSKSDGLPLKTRRQPLHKKDGRRIMTGTTNQRKRNHKDMNTENEESRKDTTLMMQPEHPSLSTVVVNIGGELPLETAPAVSHSDMPELQSSSEVTVQGITVLHDEEPKPKIPRTEMSPLPTPFPSVNSTQKVKKKKYKSKKEEPKLKKKPLHKHSETRTEHLDSESINGKKKKKLSAERSKTQQSKVKREKKPALDMPVTALFDLHGQSERHTNGFACNDGLLKVSCKFPQQKTKVKSKKTGLLLEQEQLKRKKKLKSQKAALLKLKDGVKWEHAYSSSLGKNSSLKLHKSKSKQEKIKLNTLFDKSMKTQTNAVVQEQWGNSSTEKAATEVQREGSKQELTSKTTVKTTGQNSTEFAAKSRAAGRSCRPKGKAKHDFTSQEFATMKAWARSMNGLWVTQPHSYDMELAYNLSMADQRPGCCVCMLFYNEKLDGKDWDSSNTTCSSVAEEDASTDQRTLVLTPEMCFAATSENRFPECYNAALSSDGRSALLHCSQCKIAVHASCYGETGTKADLWKCKRCEEQDYLAECCLCNLRGGALKRTTNGRWAHIVCAMAIPEVIFENVRAREPINIDKIAPARLKLKCFFCRPFIKMGNKFGGLIQCSVGKCALAFHVTCAQAAGVVMEPCDWPYAVYATCVRHPYSDKMRDNPRDYPLKDVSVGETVIAKHKNSRYYHSESHDCTTDGPPNEGVAVKVRWTDGLIYSGTFVKSYIVKMYDIEFEDGSVSRVKREDVYSQEEPLPKKVTTKLSAASDMRHENFWENKVVTERHRHVYSLYASSGSEPEDKTSINVADDLAGDSSTDVMHKERTLTQSSEHFEDTVEQPQAVQRPRKECSTVDQEAPGRKENSVNQAVNPAERDVKPDFSHITVFPE
ncbi:lysine-specific demethylase 4A-like isoform X2 [Acanthaster planci]|uniref:[histone H3]-trimethyl-L-lysine(9) demethylase n=1 Tax=Acanthaster planci TaxID=133434 RepID=A0A8B7Z8F7_ACAPL|nr:lysine-specific demethylase 4A-like isoform X2 [Acanthaster planci]